MRTPAYLLCLCASLLLSSSTQAAETKPPAPASATSSTSKAAPKPATKPASKAPAPAKAEVKEEPKIPGYVLTRANGKFLSVSLVGGNFKVAFYDNKKKREKADVARAMAKWHPKQKGTNVLSVLLPGADGMSLDGNKFVQPPYVFVVYLTLFDSADAVVESYVVNFQGGDTPALLESPKE